MSSVTVEIPESLKRGIEALAAAEGYSLSSFWLRLLEKSCRSC
jgi:hypothetical protein